MLLCCYYVTMITLQMYQHNILIMLLCYVLAIVD